MRLMAFIVISVTLSGCASFGDKPDQDEPLALDAQGLPALVLIPNPYLAQKAAAAPEVLAVFNRGIAHIEGQEWAAAEKVFSQLTAAQPELSGPWVNLGTALWRQNKTEQAEAAFIRAIEVNALNSDAYNNYAVMLREQGRFEDAKAEYLKAIAQWPHNLQAHRNLGILYDMYMGDFAEAVKHFEMAARIMGKPDRKLKGWIADTKRREKKRLRAIEKKQAQTQAKAASDAEPPAKAAEATQ